ncbi:GntR family transcriptional regulator [Kineosporia sp. NBRC 101731]|uniref:GntR family transcriptional regulator n=1 Tax=Kineosporia sp. NBRC 101731 TaxID=3032199 RepID=UPI0024A58363|nr:GntR family transcriptional regulator [Kineosporia sp. NBRC 101731]GLY31776.1 GntR family transcriptional regulator [Kineosporia sp. NBRC 101731]
MTAGGGSGRTAHRDVTERLREAIVTGSLQTGTHLVQSELAAGLDVSVTPVREALRELESQGLIDSDPFRGATVHGISLDELEEIHELRRLLLPLAVRERIALVTDAEIDEARAVLARLTPDLPNREWVQTDRALRQMLVGTPQRRNLRAILRRLSDVSELYAGLAVHSEADRRRALAGNREMLQAYAERQTGRAVTLTLRRLDEATRLTAAALTRAS